jgi:hypothetical protein
MYIYGRIEVSDSVFAEDVVIRGQTETGCDALEIQETL